jgi:asparagine synthase (glutamine-hydrolysing)
MKVCAKILPTGFDHPFRKNFRLAQKYMLNIDKDPVKTYKNFTGMGFKINGLNEVSYVTKFQGINVTQIFRSALQQDQHNYLISDVLALNDQMAMAHGLEIRMPYLDLELTDFLLSIDSTRLIKNGRKWILKSLLTKMNGKEFCQRSKEGFGLPFGHWIRVKETRTKGIFNEKQVIINKFVDHNQIRKMYNDHISRKADYSSELWSYLTLSKWLKLNGFSE